MQKSDWSTTPSWGEPVYRMSIGEVAKKDISAMAQALGMRIRSDTIYRGYELLAFMTLSMRLLSDPVP